MAIEIASEALIVRFSTYRWLGPSYVDLSNIVERGGLDTQTDGQLVAVSAKRSGDLDEFEAVLELLGLHHFRPRTRRRTNVSACRQHQMDYCIVDPEILVRDIEGSVGLGTKEGPAGSPSPPPLTRICHRSVSHPSWLSISVREIHAKIPAHRAEIQFFAWLSSSAPDDGYLGDW